jgi:hypothetical protein
MASERVVLKIEHISTLACSSLRKLLPYNRPEGGTPISEYPPRPKSPSEAKMTAISDWRLATGKRQEMATGNWRLEERQKEPVANR